MKGGSFLRAEIIRTISSFKPRGTASASTSVTKPYLYSWLAIASMVFVEVLIVSPLRGQSIWRPAPTACPVFPMDPVEAVPARREGFKRSSRITSTSRAYGPLWSSGPSTL